MVVSTDRFLVVFGKQTVIGCSVVPSGIANAANGKRVRQAVARLGNEWKNGNALRSLGKVARCPFRAMV